MDTTVRHFGQWVSVILWIVMGVIFLLFTPFYKKSQRTPSGVCLAFIVAMAFEMFGISVSMYVLAWIFGRSLPDRILWGHTLYSYIGTILSLAGITLGMLFDWATLPMLIMWPILALLYYRLAKKEEADMQAEFGNQYQAYKQRTGRFLPRLQLGC